MVQGVTAINAVFTCQKYTYKNQINFFKNGVRAYKSQDMAYKTFFNNEEVYSALFVRKIPRGTYINPDYPKRRVKLIDYCYLLSKRFSISENTA